MIANDATPAADCGISGSCLSIIQQVRPFQTAPFRPSFFHGRSAADDRDTYLSRRPAFTTADTGPILYTCIGACLFIRMNT